MIAFSRLAYTDSIDAAFCLAQVELHAKGKDCIPGCVVSLDRGFPLVSTPDFETRAELATTIKKSDDSIVAIGDWVALWAPQGHEKAVIERVLPRRNEIARVKRIGRERQPRRQVLAANVDQVLICQSLTGDGIDERLLARQMAAVAGCGAVPIFVLTKSDLVADSIARGACDRVKRIAPDRIVLVISSDDLQSIESVRSLCKSTTTTLLLGESGVGKSSLVNALLGEDAFEIGTVRDVDDKGRHTTVARRLVALPQGGLIIDAPGLRTLQILDMDASLAAAFPDIVSLAIDCRFRDCTHTNEPGCAVRDAVNSDRLEIYRYLASSAR